MPTILLLAPSPRPHVFSDLPTALLCPHNTTLRLPMKVMLKSRANLKGWYDAMIFTDLFMKFDQSANIW